MASARKNQNVCGVLHFETLEYFHKARELQNGDYATVIHRLQFVSQVATSRRRITVLPQRVADRHLNGAVAIFEALSGNNLRLRSNRGH